MLFFHSRRNAETFPAAGLAPPPGDARRGAYLTWVSGYAAELEPAMFAGLLGELAGSPQKQRSYDTAVRRLEDGLAKSPYLLGERFSGADFLVSSALAFARQAFPANALFDAYIARCRTRPAAIRSFALDDAQGRQGPR
jgi:glutathione S-transferase